MKLNKEHMLWVTPSTIIAIALMIRLSRLGDFHDLYYTVGIHSMTQSLSNFVYGSFDPVGLVTLDKPPSALWV